jgi:predicted SprT family Zn-dependent metalloprotease
MYFTTRFTSEIISHVYTPLHLFTWKNRYESGGCQWQQLKEQLWLSKLAFRFQLTD